MIEDSSGGESSRLNSAMQSLIDSADQSIILLESLDNASGVSTGFADSSYNLRPLEAKDGDINEHDRHQQNEQNEENRIQETKILDPVVNISVHEGLLHVKGIFPDNSTEFIDVEPNLTTVGELKRALCDRRDTTSTLGFSEADARVMFGGYLVEDAWLVVDCGMNFGGAIHIVEAASLDRKRPECSNFGRRKTQRVPNLPISSIASVYAQQGHQLVVKPFSNDKIADLTIFRQPQPSTTNELLWRHVRPEEAAFAELAAGFYENLMHVQDTNLYCQKLLSSYISVLQSRLEKLEALLLTSKKTPTTAQKRVENDIKELRDERNTWRLIFELHRVCRNKDITDGEDRMMIAAAGHDKMWIEMLENEAVQMLETGNEAFKIKQAAKTWLESMAAEHTININKKSSVDGSFKLRMVKKQLYQGKGNIDMDPDAVMRDGDDHMLADDMEDEAEFMKALWLHIRSGQVKEAVDLCIRLGQPWRAASICGGNLVGAAENSKQDNLPLERWGNPFRALWKITCWRFSEHAALDKSSKGNRLLACKYEELIYAVLSGNIQVATRNSLCENWEDHCWAYLHGIMQRQIDEKLYQLLNLRIQSSCIVVGNNTHYLESYANLLDKTRFLKRYEQDLEILFDELRDSQSEIVRTQANQPYQQIQSKLVTEKLQDIISKIFDLLLLDSAANSYSWDLQLSSTLSSDKISPLFLRFAAHFVMFVESTGDLYDELSAHMILKLYIRHLVKHRQLQLVPVYASRLPKAGASDIYVQLLSTVDDSLERELCVKRILKYAGMDMLSKVLRSVVEYLCEKYRLAATEQQNTKDPVLSYDVPTTELDRKRIEAIEFLCFFTELRAEALIHSNVLTRQFILEGKTAAADELVENGFRENVIGILDKNRSAQLLRNDEEIERAVRELFCWRAYFLACSHYDEWRNCTNRTNTFSKDALSFYSEEKNYVADLMYKVSGAIAATMEVLHFEHGWLKSCSLDPRRDILIRERCLPTLVFNLHVMQLESAKIMMRLNQYPDVAKAELALPLLQKSLEVADVVADERYAVYNALDQDQCRDLLHGFRESAISLAFVESILNRNNPAF